MGSTPPDKVTRFMAKAREKLASASRLLEGGFIDDTVSRVYYGLFHAVVAILERSGIDLSVRKHVYILGQYRKYFIDTKIFPEEHLSIILDVKSMREQADYGAFISIPPATARRVLDKANEIIEAIAAHLARSSPGSTTTR